MTPQLRRAELAFFFAVVAFSSLMILFGYFLQELAKTLVPEGQAPIIYAILVLVIIGLLYLFFHASRNRIFSIFGSSVEVIREPPPRPYLIVGMSPLINVDLATIHQELKAIGPAAVASNVVGYGEACNSATDNRTPLRSNWQQTIRSLWYHRKVLREVFVLDNGHGKFDDFRDYVLAAMRGECDELKVTLINDPHDAAKPFKVVDAGVAQPADYENYRYCDEGLRRGLVMVEDRLLARDIDKHCCIDVTPGIKVFSIAAGAVTFNRELIFSYANNSGDVAFYNARLILNSDHTFLPA